MTLVKNQFSGKDIEKAERSLMTLALHTPILVDLDDSYPNPRASNTLNRIVFATGKSSLLEVISWDGKGVWFSKDKKPLKEDDYDFMFTIQRYMVVAAAQNFLSWKQIEALGKVGEDLSTDTLFVPKSEWRGLLALKGVNYKGKEDTPNNIMSRSEELGAQIRAARRNRITK